MDCSPPGSSIHGIPQARILEWVVMPFSIGSSQPRDWTQVSHIAGRFFTIWVTGEAQTQARLWINRVQTSPILCLAAQSYLTFGDPMDCSPPGSSIHWIIQARILVWVAVPFSREIFLTQRLNPGLQHCRQILYCQSHQGSSSFSMKFIFKILSLLIEKKLTVTRGKGGRGINWEFGINIYTLLYIK